ncbi:MAG: hypothetical protein ACK55Z_30935, partial [bacterium]
NTGVGRCSPWREIFSRPTKIKKREPSAWPMRSAWARCRPRCADRITSPFIKTCWSGRFCYRTI